MPQADLVTFHSLTIWTTILLLITSNFAYYFAVPFISVIFKIAIKNTFILFFLIKKMKLNIFLIADDFVMKNIKIRRFSNINIQN
jgi:hypothetical protein